MLTTHIYLMWRISLNRVKTLLFCDEDHSPSDGDRTFQELRQYGQTLALVAFLSVDAKALDLEDFYFSK